MTNEFVGMVRMAQARKSKYWRETFRDIARVERQKQHITQPLSGVHMIVAIHRPNYANMPDGDACMLAFKAARDGLIDARVLEDDGPKHVRSVTYLAPIVDGAHALEIEVIPDDASF